MLKRIFSLFIALSTLSFGLRIEAAPSSAVRQEKGAPPQQTTSGRDGVRTGKQEAAPEFDHMRQQALGVIKREVERAQMYSRAANRMRVFTAAADAIWELDETQARELIREAYTQTGEPSNFEGHNGNALAQYQAALQRGQIRAEILGIVQRRDPGMAKELIGTIKEDKAQLAALHNDPLAFGSSSPQSRNTMFFAAQLAASEPQRAAALAASSLGYGIPDEIQDVFRALIATDADAARGLFQKGTEALAADTSNNIYDALILASYLRLIPKPEADKGLVRGFLTVAFNRIARTRERALAAGQLDQGLRSALFFNLNQLRPFTQIYAPELEAQVAALTRVVSQDVKPEEAVAEDLFPTEASRNDAASILSRAASEKNPENRDALYFQAALTLARQKEHERALDTAMRGRDSEKRSIIIAHLNRLHVQDLLAEKDLLAARGVIDKISEPEELAEAVASFASVARKKKADPQLVRELIDQARKSLGNNSGSAAHARAYLRLASSYSALDTQFGFELMSAAVKAANGAKDLLDLRPQSRIVHLGGASREGITAGEINGDFRPGFRSLALSDFERTVEMAQTFSNELFRGLALIAASSAVLKQKAKTP